MITAVINSILHPIVEAYSVSLAGFPLNFFSFILSSILLGMFMQAVFSIVPWLKSIFDGMMFPFRIIHVWLHIDQARKVIKKRNNSNLSDGLPPLRLTTFLSSGLDQKEEKPGLVITGMCTPKEAASIANAPLKGVIVLLLLLTLLTPFLRGSFAGSLVHLYISLGVATTSWPSTSDYQFTYNMFLANPPFSLDFILLLPVAFFVGFSSCIILTENIIFAVIWGIAASSITTWVFLMIITFRKPLDRKKTSNNRNDYPNKKEWLIPLIWDTFYQ